ncbi:glycosyl-4,4'-diaponeurosporenoate acyltransferase [Barrientosiimonas marina]|uniref:Glycosyl-4,4'-diaponeurosporenoate acyltransferase n=1 Tax=Lentibacillus kimchii TaxID=1542911 RepID=A0ABW2UXG6_9BACI
MTVATALWIVVSDIIAWGICHYAISYLCLKMPVSFFEKDGRWFRIASWERDGALWNQLVSVKRWKDLLIEGSSIVKQSYNKRYLHGTTRDALTRFAAETKRAELTHWLLIVPAPVFFLWNPVWAGWVMIGYALLANVPFILIQRYNRARIKVILAR